MTSVPRMLPRPAARAHRRRIGTASTSVVAISTFGVLVGLTGTAQAATAVPLGDATSFAVLAGAGITNTGPSQVTGDIGSFATPSIDGGITLTPGSTDHQGDSDTQAGKIALSGALTTASTATPQTPVVAGTLAGLHLPAGIYNSGSSTLDLTGTLTLDGGGSYDSVFIIQANSDLVTASNSTVELTGGAQACNVFWSVGTSATLGSDSTFVGTILADASITLGIRAEVEGRVLASVGAVGLHENVITRPDTCLQGLVPVPPSGGGGNPGTPPTTPTTPTTPTPPTAAASTESSGTAGTTRGTTYGQVDRVPVGAVDTGDGSTS